MNTKRLTSYERALQGAAAATARKRRQPPLPRAALVDTPRAWYLEAGHERPTEYAALFRARHGVMPNNFAAYDIERHAVIRLRGDEGQPVRPRGMAFEGRVCVQCGKRKPRTDGYWPKHGDMCLACVGWQKRRHRRRVQDSSRYTRKGKRRE